MKLTNQKEYCKKKMLNDVIIKSSLYQSYKCSSFLFPFSPTGGKFKEYYLSALNIIGTYTVCVGMLKIVYFVGNLDKYLLSMTDLQTGLFHLTPLKDYVENTKLT